LKPQHRLQIGELCGALGQPAPLRLQLAFCSSMIIFRRGPTVEAPAATRLEGFMKQSFADLIIY
jgi:hypothetical protein